MLDRTLQSEMSIYDTLYDFQKRIVDKFKDRKSFGLFLDMGLGKTPLSLAFAEINNCDKVIVITINSKALEPVTKDGSWLYWASKSSLNYTLFAKSDTPNFDNKRHECFVINYESLFSRERSRKKKSELKKNVLDFINACGEHNVAIIVDESHKMKNLQSQQTLAIEKIKRLLTFRAADVYTYLLTGTPFTTGFVDLYSQLKMLGYSETKATFIDRFCVRGNVPGLLGWQQPIVDYKNVDELFDIVHQFAITIKSDDVVNLPEKIFVNHVVPVSEDFKIFTQEYAKGSNIMKTYKRHNLPVPMLKDKKLPNPFFRNIANPDLKWLAETSGTFYLRCRQLSIGFQGNATESQWYDRRRLDEFKSFMTDYPDNYIIFYNFTPELLELYDICTELGYNVDVYCGEIKSTVFYDNYTKMTESEKLVNRKNVILANFASGSTGMNWQAYNKCIIFSVPLYSHYEQGIKRIHRLGQKETTIYHLFYQNNWLDAGMRKSLHQCVDYSQALFEHDMRSTQALIAEDDE